MTKNEAVFTKDTTNHKITVVRSFAASLQQVWDAWTKAEILDQWWAPKPYKAVTKSQDFKPGGHWLYAMTGPDNFKHWNKTTYITINDRDNLTCKDMFCDEAGNRNDEFPITHWLQKFDASGDTTTVTCELSYEDAAGMEKIIKTGFEQGFTMGLNNLDEYLANQ